MLQVVVLNSNIMHVDYCLTECYDVFAFVERALDVLLDFM